MQEQCPLLTGDKDLRDAAEKEKVEVHGMLWIVEQLLDRKLIELQSAKMSFDGMRSKGSRLPLADVDKLLNKWRLEDSLSSH